MLELMIGKALPERGISRSDFSKFGFSTPVIPSFEIDDTGSLDAKDVSCSTIGVIVLFLVFFVLEMLEGVLDRDEICSSS